MIYFYARVSTKEQSLSRQLAVANAYKPVDKIFSDKQSGKDFERPEYCALKEVVQAGDEVIIKELDRLGRDKEGIKDEISWFKNKGVILRILDVPTSLIDFGGQDWIADMVNNIIVEVLGAIAQQEREKSKSRQREGIDAMPIKDGKRISAKNGHTYGRQRKELEKLMYYFDQQQRGLMTVADCCKALKICKKTWYNRRKEIIGKLFEAKAYGKDTQENK